MSFGSRPAATYVAAIDTLETYVKVLANLDFSDVRSPRGFDFEDVRVNDETDRARIGSRLIAFGTPEVLDAFRRVSVLDRDAFALVFGEKTPGPKNLEAWRSQTSEAIDKLRDGLTEFEQQLNGELTS
jgi:hypothetical protein